MKDAFVRSLIELAKKDKQFFLLTTGVGSKVVKRYADQFPKQFFDLGGTKQITTGIATGMAIAGKKVFTYSVGDFSSMDLENFQEEAFNQQVNLVVVVSRTGIANETSEKPASRLVDLGRLQAFPGATVVVPSDPAEAGEATLALARKGGVGFMYLES